MELSIVAAKAFAATECLAARGQSTIVARSGCPPASDKRPRLGGLALLA